MKASFIVLVLAVAFAAQPSFAATTTIGDLVSSGLCPEAKARLSENTLLNTALTLAASTQVDLPDSGTPILFAPSDAALMAALPKLGVSVAQLAGKPELIKEILSLHLASAASLDDSEATTVNGQQVTFDLSGADSSIAAFVASTDNAARSVVEGANTAKTEDVVACENGPIAVFTDSVFLPGAAPSPAAAPAPAPAAAPKVTIGSLVGSVCSGIKGVVESPNFTTLASFLNDPAIANTEITVPKGTVVIAAPTNAAFEALINAVGPEVADNKTIVAEILANHIAVASAPSDDTAKALSGEELSFWTEMGGVGGNMAPVPTAIAMLAKNKNGVISDASADEMAKVIDAVDCAPESQYAFVIDSVLVPSKYEPLPTPTPAPAPAAAPEPTPAPGPVPSGGAGVASMGLAAVVAMAAAILA